MREPEADTPNETETTETEGRFPDTPEHKVPQRLRALSRRRAKNKMRRATKRKQR